MLLESSFWIREAQDHWAWDYLKGLGKYLEFTVTQSGSSEIVRNICLITCSGFVKENKLLWGGKVETGNSFYIMLARITKIREKMEFLKCIAYYMFL